MSDAKTTEIPELEDGVVDDVPNSNVEPDGSEEEKEDATDKESAQENEETQDDKPVDNKITSKNKFIRSLSRDKVIKILKWTGIISIPLTTVTILFFLQPAFITNFFNKPEQIVHTPKTAAIQWTAEELEMINIVGQTLTETEKIWNHIFTEKGGFYKKPDFTIFTDRINSVCIDSDTEKDNSEKITEQSSIGSFYCPQENRVYIDLSLHRDLKDRLDIPGDFAQGYIVAHEIGHHVQNLAEISRQVPAARLKLGKKEFDKVMQRIELQADCFAGIWARHTAEDQYNTSREDFADALNAVTHYSREHLKQKEANDIMPDPFTHSSAHLRLRWFTIGYDKGTFDACDTFTIREL